MKKSVGKLGIILLFVILFPTLFFSTYEIVSISNNDQVVDSIYASHLENIVFSLKQYSYNEVERWSNRIVNSLDSDWENVDSICDDLIRNNSALNSIYFLSKDESRVVSKENATIDGTKISEVLLARNEEVKQLEGYLDKGYRKIIPISIDSEALNLLIFIISKDSEPIVCAMLIGSQAFIKEQLAPQIQKIAQDKFIISIVDRNTKEQIYSSDLYAEDGVKMRVVENLWLFNSYEVGIKIKGDPIEQMVNKRTKINIIMLVLMDLVLMLGAWLVFRNVRKEVELAQIKSEFVSNVSHEIKTPLALINMYSETLEMGRVKTEQKQIEYIKVINREANRLSRMVNKILNFSKIENGKRDYKMSKFNLNDIVEQVIATYTHHFKNKGFEYKIQLNDDLPESDMDYEAVTDAINNLIDNAIKYSGDKKQVRITTGITLGYVFVEVSDDGIGIEKNEQNLIFDKFYRVTKGNLAHHAKGSGIGLSIVKHIMDAHNGEIRIESASGEGSAFKLLFPLL